MPDIIKKVEEVSNGMSIVQIPTKAINIVPFIDLSDSDIVEFNFVSFVFESTKNSQKAVTLKFTLEDVVRHNGFQYIDVSSFKNVDRELKLTAILRNYILKHKYLPAGNNIYLEQLVFTDPNCVSNCIRDYNNFLLKQKWNIK